MNYASDLELQASQRQNLLAILEKKKFADLRLIVGPQKKVIKVNRAFLASTSTVFEQLLYPENDEQHPSEIELPDISSAAFQSVIYFAYGNDPKLNEENILYLKSICDKFQIDALSSSCSIFWKKSLTPNSLCTLLNQAMLTNSDQFIKECQEYLNKFAVSDADTMLKSAGFLKMNLKSMIVFLQTDGLKVHEHTLWNFMLKWADSRGHSKEEKEDDIALNQLSSEDFHNALAQQIVTDDIDKENVCHQQKDRTSLLRSIKKYIYFGAMDGRYFVENVQNEGIFDQNELITILTYFQCPEKGCGDFGVQRRDISPSCDDKEITDNDDIQFIDPMPEKLEQDTDFMDYNNERERAESRITDVSNDEEYSNLKMTEIVSDYNTDYTSEYSQIKKDFDWFYVTCSQTLLTNLKEVTKDKDVLNIIDIGCGDGNISRMIIDNTSYLNKNAIDIVAIDPSESQIESAKQKSAANRYNTINYEICGAQDIKHKNKFDVALSFWPFGYSINVDMLKEMMKACFESLKDGGICIGVTVTMQNPNILLKYRDFHKNKFNIGFDKDIDGKVKLCDGDSLTQTLYKSGKVHFEFVERYYSPDTYDKIAKTVGFKDGVQFIDPKTFNYYIGKQEMAREFFHNPHPFGMFVLKK